MHYKIQCSFSFGSVVVELRAYEVWLARVFYLREKIMKFHEVK